MMGKIRIAGLALAVAAGMVALGAPAQAQQKTTAKEAGIVGTGPDDLRTGGCSGCFQAQMRAALNQFSSITRVFRLCATASPNGGTSSLKTTPGGAPTCDGDAINAAGGTLLDYVVIEGDLKDSTAAANAATNDFYNNTTGAVGADGTNDGFGVPGGDTDVVYRVSANGSGQGNSCAQGASGIGIGYVAPEGFDGVPNTTDDAGGTGTYADTSALNNNTHGCVGVDGLLGTGDDLCAPLAPISGVDGSGRPRILDRVNSWPLAAPATLFVDAPGKQIAVVNYDRNNNGAIDRADSGGGGYLGAAGTDCLSEAACAASRGPWGGAPGTARIQDGVLSNTESTNLSMFCNNGCGDLPGQDLVTNTGALPAFNSETKLGAQIFKLLVTKDVKDATQRCFVNNGQTAIACGAACTAAGGVCQDAKVQLWDPQIENVFGNALNNSTCAWESLGAVGTINKNVTTNPFNVTASGIFLADRTQSSGTRNTFRETFMVNQDSSHQEFRNFVGQTEQASGLANCTSLKKPGPGAVLATKNYNQFSTEGGVLSCLQSGNCRFNGIGYANSDAICADTGSNCYDAVVEGVDPQTNNMRDMVRCGMYRYWGPLACGLGNRPTNAHFTALRNALGAGNQALLAFTGTEAYIPKAQVAFFKEFTDAQYTMEFTPANCPVAPLPPAPKP